MKWRAKVVLPAPSGPLSAIVSPRAAQAASVCARSARSVSDTSAECPEAAPPGPPPSGTGTQGSREESRSVLTKPTHTEAAVPCPPAPCRFPGFGAIRIHLHPQRNPARSLEEFSAKSPERESTESARRSPPPLGGGGLGGGVRGRPDRCRIGRRWSGGRPLPWPLPQGEGDFVSALFPRGISTEGGFGRCRPVTQVTGLPDQPEQLPPPRTQKRAQWGWLSGTAPAASPSECPMTNRSS